MLRHANVIGFPRPLEVGPDTKLRPVPWTQGGGPWGGIDASRQWDCVDQSLCLVCGEFVEFGVVFWRQTNNDRSDNPVPSDLSHLITYAELGATRTKVMDGAPLHDRCALITRSHCKTVRAGIRSGNILTIPYEGPLVYGRS